MLRYTVVAVTVTMNEVARDEDPEAFRCFLRMGVDTFDYYVLLLLSDE